MSPTRRAAPIPPSAILLIVGAVACFTILDSMVKFLAVRYPVPLLVWARYAVQAVAMVIWLAPTMGARPRALAADRGCSSCAARSCSCSSICFFNALRWLPLADATAINYTTPMLVILLSVVVLKERMTRSRWAFVVAGLAGMLLIVRPGASILHGGGAARAGRRRVLRGVPDPDAQAARRGSAGDAVLSGAVRHRAA